MKPFLALLLAGVAALVLRGVLSGVLPVGLRPDLGLVVVVGLGLQRPGASGLLLATGLGFVADVLTGALLGQHPLLYALVFAVTRLAGAQLDLRRVRPTAFLVAALSVACGLGSVAVSGLFADAVVWPRPGRLFTQAAVDAAVAPLVLPLLAGLMARLSDEDRRAIHLAPRRREA